MTGRRVPTGEVGREIRISVSADGPVPLLILQSYRRSRTELRTAYQADGPPLTLDLRFAEHLLEAVRVQAHVWSKRPTELSLWQPARWEEG